MIRERQWYRASAAEVFDQLGSRKDAGLTAAEAQQRLLEYGANELTRAHHVSAREVFAAQFKNLLIVILIIAVVLSAILGRGATHRRIGSVGILSPARR